MHYKELLKGVNAYNQIQQDSFPQELYDEEIDYFKAFDTSVSQVERVKIVVNKWGKCRVHIEDEKLQKTLKSFQEHYISSINWDLTNTSLWDYHDEIVGIFSVFENVLKYTGASKALHILNPKFYMMWDKAIREGYGCWRNGEGYFNFLNRSQKEIQEVLQTYAKDHGSTIEISRKIYVGQTKTVVKLLDEYNWAKY